MTTIADPIYSRKAAAVMNSKLVLDLPPDLQWALRDALAEHDSEETLPSHLKRLFDDALHPKIVEAGLVGRYAERLHPRGRGGQWIDKPGHALDLVRGKATRGKKGRKAPVKGKAKGWQERIGELRQVPILQQRELLARRSAAMQGRSAVLDDPEHKKVLDEWWGLPGVPNMRGKYQTIGGDPGTEFQAQHERIMEAGAHIDAEINRRLDAKGGIVRRVKTLEADLRLEEKWLKEAEKREEEAAYEAIAKHLVQSYDYDPERVTGAWAKEQHLAWAKEMKRSERKNELPRATGDQATVADLFEYDRFNIAEKVGIDLQALHDKVFTARDRVFRGRDGVRVARAVRQESRRDVAYDVLGDVREFAKPGDLQFEVELDHVIKGNHAGLLTYDAKYMAGPKLERAALWLPRDWVRSSNEHPSVVVPGWKARGHYSHALERHDDGTQVSAIVGSPSPEAPGVEQGVATMVHELVHRIEDVRDGVKGAEWAFYASRVSPGMNQRWEEPRKLAEITGHDGYDDHEIAREDHFVKAYSGKDYGNGYPDMNNYYEILTMGIQDLVGGEHGTIDQDEEYRHFVFGALALL